MKVLSLGLVPLAFGVLVSCHSAPAPGPATPAVNARLSLVKHGLVTCQGPSGEVQKEIVWPADRTLSINEILPDRVHLLAEGGARFECHIRADDQALTFPIIKVESPTQLQEWDGDDDGFDSPAQAPIAARLSCEDYQLASITGMHLSFEQVLGAPSLVEKRLDRKDPQTCRVYVTAESGEVFQSKKYVVSLSALMHDQWTSAELDALNACKESAEKNGCDSSYCSVSRVLIEHRDPPSSLRCQWLRPAVTAIAGVAALGLGALAISKTRGHLPMKERKGRAHESGEVVEPFSGKPISSEAPIDLVPSLLRRDFASLESLLRSFDPRAINVASLEELSQTRAVYKLLLRKGATPEQNVYGVVRILPKDSALYELWVRQMAMSSPSILVSPIHVISPSAELKRVVRTKLKEKAGFDGNLKDIVTGRDDDFLVSVSFYLPGKEGFHSLGKNDAIGLRQFIGDKVNQLEKSLWNVSDVKKELRDIRQRMRLPDRDLMAILARTTPEEVQLLREDLAPALGSLDRFRDPNMLVVKIIETLVERRVQNPAQSIEALMARPIWNRLDPSMKTQLADLWAFSRLTLIDDLHSANWLYDPSSRAVLAHDLNHFSKENAAKETFVGDHFLLKRAEDADFASEMKKSISQPMREWLQKNADGKLKLARELENSDRLFLRSNRRGLPQRAKWLLKD